jgi:hypothetical protein
MHGFFLVRFSGSIFLVVLLTAQLTVTVLAGERLAMVVAGIAAMLTTGWL